jgi:hypothetical protein
VQLIPLFNLKFFNFFLAYLFIYSHALFDLPTFVSFLLSLLYIDFSSYFCLRNQPRVMPTGGEVMNYKYVP